MSFKDLPDKHDRYPERITLAVPQTVFNKLEILKKQKGRDQVAEELRKLIAKALESVDFTEAS